jgi:hypothetical protein
MSVRPNNSFFSETELRALEAITRKLPVFLTDVKTSTPVNATPYLIRYALFQEAVAQWQGRKILADQLDVVKIEIENSGFDVQAILVGGSFTELSLTQPRDIDCLILYSSKFNADASKLADIQKLARHRHVDCRLIPIDGDPLALVKLISYFTVLYSRSKSRNEITRCLLLLDCRAVDLNS